MPGCWRWPAEMDSTPPAIMMSEQPLAIWLAAMAMEFRPEEQARLMVVPAVVTGSFERITARRAILPPCSPIWLAAPTITSSISAGSTLELRSSRASMQCASMSSGRVRLNVPLNDFASPVLTLSTTTTSRILPSGKFGLGRGLCPFVRVYHNLWAPQGTALISANKWLIVPRD